MQFKIAHRRSKTEISSNIEKGRGEYFAMFTQSSCAAGIQRASFGARGSKRRTVPSSPTIITKELMNVNLWENAKWKLKPLSSNQNDRKHPVGVKKILIVL